MPQSQLQLLRKLPLEGKPGLKAVVVLQIDESGRVVGVTPLTDTPIPNLESTLMKWQFTPYTLNGRPVPVKAMLNITVQ